MIRVEGVSKKYVLGKNREPERYQSLRDVLTETLKAPYRRLRSRKANAEANAFWAVRDVSFEIRRGEVVGIIGRNGAGKSTLLKILSRITEPTTGRISLRGRVASLLEVGTGFHPELTGRENIFLNGAVLGMPRSEIRAKFDEIVAFAEVEKFIDTPVKRYSSGMYVRLAFAVAAHLEPEILVVDEVLAVGDAQFQKKCLGKLENVAQHGRTVLFVSHNMAAVRTLCTRAIRMQAGRLVGDTGPEEGIRAYLGEVEEQAAEVSWPTPEQAPGDAVLRLKSVSITGDEERAANVNISRPFQIEIEYWVLTSAPDVSVSVHFNYAGAVAFVSGNAAVAQTPGVYKATCSIPAHLMNNGVYSVTVFLITSATVFRVMERDVVAFNVQEITEREYLGTIIGFVRPALDWQLQQTK